MDNLESFRAEFPVTQNATYLNHAAVAPIPLRTQKALRQCATDVCNFGVRRWHEWQSTIEQVRAKAARLVGAASSEIAFVKNTSEGISLAASGLELQRGDKVVSVDGEFPANIYPWMRLEDQGVELDLVPQRNGRVDMQELVDHLDSRTRVLAISFVQFLSGFRCDLRALGEICKRKGVSLGVDAIQGLGVFPIDVKGSQIDFLAADSHKWLLGPEGIGIFYCSSSILKRIRPPIVGWTSVTNWSDYLDYKLEYRPDAGRFECGTLNTLGIFGLGASLDLIFEVGIPRIQSQVLKLTDYLCAGLTRKGYRIQSPREADEASGIVSFDCARLSTESISQILRAEKIGKLKSLIGAARFECHHTSTTIRTRLGKLLSLLPEL